MPSAPLGRQINNKSHGDGRGDELAFARVFVKVGANEVRDVGELRLPNKSRTDEAGVVQTVYGAAGSARNAVQAGNDVVPGTIADGDGNLDQAA